MTPEAKESLIWRVRAISLELPLLTKQFDDAVQSEIDRPKKKGETGSIAAVENEADAMLDYQHTLADELENIGPECNKLAVALRGGLDIPKPYGFIFGAIVELQNYKYLEEKPSRKPRAKKSPHPIVAWYAANAHKYTSKKKAVNAFCEIHGGNSSSIYQKLAESSRKRPQKKP